MRTAGTVIHPAVQTEAIRLYCGCCEDEWGQVPVQLGPFAFVSPIYSRGAKSGYRARSNAVNVVRLSEDTIEVDQDSGAFSERPEQRLTHKQALKRQVDHAIKYGYADRVKCRTSYDLLIDEKWGQDGRRYKSRWSETDAWDACVETIKAARFLSEHREGLSCILSVQGVTVSQYLKCAQAILPYYRTGDKLGLGGWCVLGKFPVQFMPVFRETMHKLIPFVAKEGVQQIHILGCMYAPALGELLYLCDRHHIHLSTDSVGPSLRPVYGSWGYWSWTNPHYQRPAAGPELGRHRRIHVKLSRRWLANFREREPQLYRWMPVARQGQFF